MGKFVNAVGNTAGIVPRTAGSVLYGTLDTAKAAGNVFSDFGGVVQDTSSQLKEVLSSSRNTGKWYNKLYQVPAGVAIGAGVVVEGAVRSVLEPTRNAILNVRDVFGNFFKNIGNTIGATFDTSRPVSDFRFEHLKTKKHSGENWFSKLAWWKKSKASSSSSVPASAPVAPAPTPAPVPAQTAVSPQAFQNFQTTITNQHQAMMAAISSLTAAVQQMQQQMAQNQVASSQSTGAQASSQNSSSSQNSASSSKQASSPSSNQQSQWPAVVIAP